MLVTVPNNMKKFYGKRIDIFTVFDTEFFFKYSDLISRLDDFVENGDMFEIDESVSDGGIAGATSAREKSKIRRLGFETRTRIANTHFRC